MHLISAHQLCVGRGDRILFEGLDLAVAAGDVLHVKGRNGVGKSSLIEVLVGLRPARSGTINRAAPDQFHWLGHRNGLHPDLSLRENLVSWCALSGVPEAKADSALEQMGLRALRARRARHLSMGQKRRAALARVLLMRRPLWILDEPLSGLDAKGTVELGQMMNEHLAREGGIVITSHQPLPGRLPRVTVLELA